jgi:GGDEF domain-containing protein
MAAQSETAAPYRGGLFSLVDAYSFGIVRRRGLMAALGLAGSAVMLAGIRYSQTSPAFAPGDTIVLVAGFCVFATCSVLTMLVSGRWLYHVVVCWVGAAMLTPGLVTLNALFGDTTQRLLHDQAPVHLAFLPITIVFAYTYLATRHAALACSLYAAVLGASAITYVLLHWPTSLASSSVAFLLLTLLAGNPAVMIMMHLTRDLHLHASRYLEQAVARERRQRAMSERDGKLDPVTLALSRQGGIERLQHLLADETTRSRGLLLFALMMDPTQSDTRLAGNGGWGHVLREIDSCIKDTLGPGTETARLGGTHFLAWNTSAVTSNRADLCGRLLTRLHTIDLPADIASGFSVGAVQAEPGQSAEMLIEAANFELFLAQSRGGSQFAFAESCN